MSTVKYFHSAMTGAPTLNGTAGSLIAVLDACLVNGFGLRTVDSLVVSGNIATMTIAAGHSFEPDTIALVSGATPAALNGEKVVLSTTANTVTFAAPGVADQTATGAINCKLAPAGWEKAFSGTNLAAYRSLDVTSTRNIFRFDDSAAQNARLIGYESMSDINTGVGPFPTTAMLSGGFWWAKANSTATTARTWVVVADQRTVWYWVNTTTSTGFWKNGVAWGFGDFTSYKSGDAFSAFTSGAGSDLSNTNNATVSYVGHGYVVGSSTNWVSTPRSFTALGGAIWLRQRPESYVNADGYSGELNQISTYPNPADNSLILTNMGLQEATGPVLRGRYRGLYFCPQGIGATAFTTRDKINGQGTLAGRKLMAIKGATPPGTGDTTVTAFIDITGPWE